MSIVSPNRYSYVAVAATSSSTFGTAGAYLHSVIVNVQSNSEATCIVKDGNTAIVSVPATQAAGVYVYTIGIGTTGQITALCSGNSNCRVVGLFTTAN